MTAASSPIPQFALAQQFPPAQAVHVDIVDPFGQPTPIRITLAGRYTKAFKAAVARANEATPADADAGARLLEILIAATTAWDGILDAAGAPLPCTPELVRALYTHDDIPYVITQVTQAFTDQTRFFERAKTT